MKKLDWYIIKKFFSTFFFAIFLFTIIAVVIDTSEKTDDFVKSGFSFGQLITKYFAGFIPHIVGMLFPLFVFIAVIFFTSKMAGRSEIIAILASGTSYNRFLRPYFLGGLFLGGVLWLATQYVIPVANEIRVTFKQKYVDGNSSYNPLLGRKNEIYFKADSFGYAGMAYYDTLAKNGSNFFYSRVQNNIITYNLRSDNIRWDTAGLKWIADNVVEHTFNGMQETVKFSASKELSLNLRPNELKRDEYAKDKMTTPELSEFIRRETMRGTEGINALKVERYKRDATPAAVLLLTLIGAVVASRKVRGGSGVHLAIGFITAAIFIFTDRFSTMFSTKGNFPPLLAAWLPNLVFGFVAYYLYKRAPK
jgi:lipopolysaccharide export system permease protein